MRPVCTKAEPYHGGRSCWHPDMVPVKVDHRGMVIVECPNCGLSAPTVPEKEFLEMVGAA